MNKYLSEECKQCDEYIEPYGCTWAECPIKQAIESYNEEEESRIHPIFDSIMKNI